MIKALIEALIRKNHYGYYYSKEYYYRNTPTSLDYLKLYSGGKPILRTDQEIKFLEKIKFGQTKRQVIRELGNPKFRYTSGITKSHEILVYKLRIGDYRIKSEMHFFDKVFFLGCNIIQGGHQDDNCEISNHIVFKYVKQMVSGAFDHCIMDDAGNSIEFSDEVNFIAIYKGKSSHQIEQLIDTLTQHRIRLENKQLLCRKRLIEKL